MPRWKFIRGHYTATYNGTVIGTTRSGFIIRQRTHTEPIMVDEGGDTPVDAINRGTEYAIEMRDFVEFGKVKAAMLGSSGSATAVGQGLGKVGTLQTDNAKVLILAPATGNEAGNATITYTANNAVAEGDVDIPLHLGLKTGSLTFICYPDPTGSTNATCLAISESGTTE